LKVGTNDMVNSRKLIPLKQYEKNLTQLVQKIKKSGAKILLATILPVKDEYLFSRHERTLYDLPPSQKVQQANAVIRQIAKKEQIEIVDLYELFTKNGEVKTTADSWMQNEANTGYPDGVHPNGSGYEAIAKAILEVIRAKKLPETGIICFGDSITYGSKVPGAGTTEGQTYAAWLQKLLQP